MMKQEYMDSGKWKTIGASNDKSKKKKKSKARSQSKDVSPPRRDRSHERSRRISNDNSPPRRRRKSSDESPPRRNNDDRTSKRRDPSSDASPPRRSRAPDNDNSPPRRPQLAEKNRRSSDASPPRRHRRSPDENAKRKDSDASPPRRLVASPQIQPDRRDSDNSPPRQSRQREGSSRQRRSRWSPEIKREPESPPRSSRMTKTLDGKASGLQDAKTLKRENDEFKARQEKQFQDMRPEMSGRHADIVIRDRRGRNKEFEGDVETERRKAEAEEARKKEYDRWGKGLKQIDDLEKRYQEHMHEASKPLARSADDKDLQDHLRNQERLDDPMLEYMRKKKDEVSRKKGVEVKPKYVGQAPDNRFNIRPGYRWDGVDRSNGFEKKYFNMISSKKSMEEEAYRYSTEDM